jgi:hypothetical protein
MTGNKEAIYDYVSSTQLSLAKYLSSDFYSHADLTTTVNDVDERGPHHNVKF